jgi:murein endopeptidase
MRACALLALLISAVLVTPAAAQVAIELPTAPVVTWRTSHAVGAPWAGRLVRGVQLPPEGPSWFTWDPALNETPDRGWRRWGTDTLVRTVLAVADAYHADYPWAPRLGIGDLSRPHGGYFGREFGGLGHASHQNGLDVDVWYPRLDGRERRPLRPSQVDVGAAQDLVDRFVAAGAEKVFVGPSLGLEGPRGVVVALVHHDDHLHVRLPHPAD